MALAGPCMRELRRLAAGAVVVGGFGLSLVMNSCGSSPVPPQGTGGEQAGGTLPLGENPFSDEGPTRAAIVAAYFEQRGCSFSAAIESGWVALDSQAMVVLSFRNRGALPISLVLRRDEGFWPFDSVEHGCVRFDVAAKWASLRTGLQSLEDQLRLDLPDDLEIAPGSDAELRVPLELALPPDGEALIARVQPTLHPLAIRCGEEPERVIAIRFPTLEVRYGPAAVVLAAAEDPAPFERALADVPGHVVAAALRRAETGRAETIDRLIVTLPGPDAAARRARCVALEWLTERRLGDSVERWRSWWEAEGNRGTTGNGER
jgi:hypothetical protein